MSLKEKIIKITPNLVREYAGSKWKWGKVKEFSFDQSESIAADIRQKYAYDGDMLDYFVTNKGPRIHKWHHYIPLYDRYFSPYRGRNIRFLEIGVSEGGSLQLWRRYFGRDAVIFGIDINPECRKLNARSAQIRIGSQTDPKFLDSVIKEMGGLDIVLDDGSHEMAHVRASLEVLFPRLNDGGIYMIEDLHTAYFRGYGGGYHSKGNFYSSIFELVDDMHNWYHKRGVKHTGISDYCSGIHIHDSIVVIDKHRVHRPAHSGIG